MTAPYRSSTLDTIADRSLRGEQRRSIGTWLCEVPSGFVELSVKIAGSSTYRWIDRSIADVVPRRPLRRENTGDRLWTPPDRSPVEYRSSIVDRRSSKPVVDARSAFENGRSGEKKTTGTRVGGAVLLGFSLLLLNKTFHTVHERASGSTSSCHDT